ncbi:hypothetical protein UVI_02032150 [Ustilaginoidea virens]|uniref:Uncharacterized protein n=1 Tax=Ustilaginoidea virens TaxID=1159556 RepID=A0A1B5KU45_USTVR|nr:hypothetical protein UVI_02032150 [Ustilaginoidea virens]
MPGRDVLGAKGTYSRMGNSSAAGGIRPRWELSASNPPDRPSTKVPRYLPNVPGNRYLGTYLCRRASALALTPPQSSISREIRF